MKLILKQIEKDLFSANFEILQDNNIVGNVSLKGELVTNEACLVGTLYGKTFELNCVSKFFAGSNEKFRPYNILENNDVVGEIYQTEFKKNIFSKYEYDKCIYNQKEYNLYSVGLGEKIVDMLYQDNIQIAQIEKEGTIYNDLHVYDIYSINEDSAFIAVLFSCYMYVIACYKAGEKVVQSVKKTYNKTLNKELIAKYNPDWTQKLEK